MTFDDVRQIVMTFPGVEEHIAFRSPHFKIGKLFLTSIAKSTRTH